MHSERPTELAAIELDPPGPGRVEVPIEGEGSRTTPTLRVSGRQQPVPVAGWVLESNGLGVGGATVLVRGRRRAEQSESARTDADGSFSLQLDGAEWKPRELANVHVSFEGGERLFSGVVVLGQEITILLPESLLLAGRVVDLPSDIEGVSMRFDVPAGDRFATNVFVGRTELDDDGSFALLARPPAHSEEMLLTFFSGSQPLATITVAVTELTLPGGAVLDLELGRVRILIEDAQGSALEGVHVTAATLDTSPVIAHVSGASDDEGRLDLILPRGPVELCASREGFATKVWGMDVLEGDESGVESIALVRADDEWILRGTVVGANGSPLSSASVSAFPFSKTNVGFSARSSTATAVDGSFTLGVPAGAELEIVAVHRVHGEGPRTVLPPGTHSVQIQFDGQGEVLLELSAAPAETVARAGPIQCLLVDRKRSRVVREHVWGSPSPLSNVPAGDYNLYVFWPGMDVYGASPVTVRGGEAASCPVLLVPAPWLEGEVVDSGGRPLPGAAIHLESGPSLTLHPWERATSGPDGSFRLLRCSGSRPHDLVARAADGRTARLSDAPNPARIVVP